MNRLVVSTECPMCGAPLDFSEGSNAVQCGHCRSNLLVTGRRRVLSYYIAPKIEARDAAVKVMFAQREAGERCRISKATLYFVPYYRLTGDDLRWEKMEIPPPPPPPEDDNLLAAIGRLAKREPPVLGDADEDADGGRLSLHDRYVERSFIACPLPEVGLYSLGIRPSVLRLVLFRGDAVRQLGKVVAFDVSPEVALSRGMKVVEIEPILQRRVIGRLLSLIYFPYWVVEMERPTATVVSFVDAVSGAISAGETGVRWYETLNRAPAADPPSAGFRPLVCPNCGGDFPVRPDDIVLFCAACQSAWEVDGDELNAVAYEVGAAPATAAHAALKYLPFWRLMIDGQGGAGREFYVPAFHCRRLKILVDLARALAEKPPAGGGTLLSPDAEGCRYDQDDARLLAEFVYPPSTPRPRRAIADLQEQRLSVRTAVLMWLPFQIRGPELIDCSTGHALNRQLLR